MRACSPIALAGGVALAAGFAVLDMGSALLPAHARSGNSTEMPSLPSRFALGQRPFSSASSWNTPIPPTATYAKLDWPVNARFGVAWSGYSPAIYLSSASDPLVSVLYPPGWGYAGGALQIRMPLDADGAQGTDGELLVIADDVVHNFWQFRRLNATTATATSYGAADVRAGSGWGRASPPRGAGIVATGSSQLAGLLVQAETDEGEIEHALQICIDSALAKPGFTGEAIHGDGKNPNGIARQGERLAIPADTPIPSGLTPLGQKVFRAYRKYGAFVVDVAGGQTNLRAQSNAYDRATMKALDRDVAVLTPMLRLVQ